MPQLFSSPGATVQFGEFEVDPTRGTLRRNGQPVAIQEKPLQVLLALLERPGDLVTREELCKRLWPGDDYGSFEDGLNTAVRKLRVTLNDSIGTPQFIETVPKRGYRFIAAIAEATAAASEPVPVIEEAASKVPVVGTPGGAAERGRRLWRLAVVVGALALAAGAVWMARLWHSSSKIQATVPITSLAVLPLTNLTGDNAQEYFADGMTDELTTSLAQIGGLRVISETSARRYRATNKSVPEIARELGVDAIVEGAVARSGGEVRITAQLISARDDRHVWAESFERNGADTLGLQPEVARSIADRIHVVLSPAEADRLKTLPTNNLAAYDAYLRARYFGRTGLQVKADNEKSLSAAEEALALDTGFAQAYVVEALALAQRIFIWAGGKDDSAKATVALDKAIALNPNLADAYVVRANLYYNHVGNFDIVNAVAAYKKAIALNPNLSDAHLWLGAELTHAGLHDRAIAEYKLALELDPFNDEAKPRLSRALWQSGRFEESVQNYERYNLKSLEEAIPLAYSGRRQNARELIAALTPNEGGPLRQPHDYAAVSALLYAMDGNPPKAESEIQQAIQLGGMNDHFHHAAFLIAAAYAELGRPHEAVRWLRRTEKIGMPNYPLFHDNPSMQKLQGSPEYDQYMAEFKPRWDQFANGLR